VQFLLLAAFLIIPFSFSAVLAQSGPNITVNGSLSSNKVKRGRTVQASIVMNIPSGYHVNSSRPLEKFLIATQLKVEAPQGMRVGAVSYPRAVLRKFQFSKNRVSVYEGRPTMGFSISVPNDFATGSKEIKVRLRYQSCNDESCFPPQNKDVSLWLTIE
jgi:thiol:disulfide interchange protein DsbD